jgi:hypothetical protein
MSLPSHLDTTLDDFYLFEGKTSNIPRKLPLKEFGKDFDLVKDVIAPTPVSDPVTKLWSDKSGLSLSFESNRTLRHISLTDGSPLTRADTLQKLV